MEVCGALTETGQIIFQSHCADRFFHLRQPRFPAWAGRRDPPAQTSSADRCCRKLARRQNSGGHWLASWPGADRAVGGRKIHAAGRSGGRYAAFGIPATARRSSDTLVRKPSPTHVWRRLDRSGFAWNGAHWRWRRPRFGCFRIPCSWGLVGADGAGSTTTAICGLIDAGRPLGGCQKPCLSSRSARCWAEGGGTLDLTSEIRRIQTLGPGGWLAPASAHGASRPRMCGTRNRHGAGLMPSCWSCVSTWRGAAWYPSSF